jgi:gamma-glutamylcyclotransferase
MSATLQTFLMFAYGSNMLSSRIQERCPSARALGVAELHGYELKWHKRSQDGSGKCDVVQTSDAHLIVFGVLHEIPLSEKPALDMAEGLGYGYESKNVDVGFKGALRMASIYYATDIDPSLKPYSWYKALVVAGAIEHELPETYIERLVATDAIVDHDREHHNRNAQLSAPHRRGSQS